MAYVVRKVHDTIWNKVIKYSTKSRHEKPVENSNEIKDRRVNTELYMLYNTSYN